MKRTLCAVLCAALLCASLLLPATAALDATAQNLLNAASLTPLYTGYSPLDQIIKNIFNSRFSAGISTFEKVKACYDYVNTGATYRGVTPPNSTYNAISSECNYYKNEDAYLVARAYHFLQDKKGSCIDFADAFMVLARAVGLECYVMHGTYDSGSHYWNLIKLSGTYYVFDTEVDWRSAGSSWNNPRYGSFCLKESSDSHRSCNRSTCIAEFGNFKCRNKTNNPGTTVPGSTTTVTQTTPVTSTAYTAGTYRTFEPTNFRAGHSTSSEKYMLISSGVTVTATEIYVDNSSGDVLYWGKITYSGKTGWIALNWSTKLSGSNTGTSSTPTKQTSTLPASNPTGTQTPQTVSTTSGNPGVTYSPGAYTTQEKMNFRSSPSLGASIYSEIPVGTTLIVTEVSGEWGKTTYQGTTGWMMLQYSTRSEAKTEYVVYAIPGDTDGDGEITAEDARIVLRYCVSLEHLSNAYLIRADADCDGEITPEDARLVLRRSVHLE